MSFQVKVIPSGHQFFVEEDEAILDGALRSGLAFPYGCRGGACGSCMGKLVQGTIDYGDDEPMALGEEDEAAGQALFCISRATSDLEIEMCEVGAVEDIPIRLLDAVVTGMTQLNEEVMEIALSLENDERLQYLAGQYVDFILRDGRRRAFSIANAPHDDTCLTFHVRHIRGGRFTDHVFSDMQIGEKVHVEGPLGTFFMREESSRPMLMLATGTGFGPLKAMIEHAIAEQASRPIHLYWGVRNQADLYCNAMACEWAERNSNIHYIPVLSRPEHDWQGRTGYVQDAVAADFTDLSDYEMYACGHPDMIYSAREALLKNGIDSDRCFSDAFSWAED